MKPRNVNATAKHAQLILAIAAGLAVLVSQISSPACRAAITIKVQADQPGARINSAMWGIFFEDINFGADGGLYAELIKNRSFEFPKPLMGWRELGGGAGKVEVLSDDAFDSANPHYVRVHSEGGERFGLANEGFHGMGIRVGDKYDFSARVRVVSGTPKLSIELTGASGQSIGRAEVVASDSHWQKVAATIVASSTDPKARFDVVVQGSGVVDLDMVSLFPQKTWKNRPGGLRADMVQMLADMHPGFLRFPGGCIVEGRDLSNRYQWKKTLGPAEDRKLIMNRWNIEFRHRPTPDYFQSFGLGFFEFFQLCEDLGASPLPILNCGMACQFNTGQLVPMDQLDPYIQDMLDLIEFANGPATSTWGGRRAEMGHPEPFNLKMIGVGNEQWGPQYIERYAAVAKILKAKHPEVSLVSAAGPSPADERFQFLWPKLRELSADVIDEHCYANPIWFLSNTHRYDQYDRKGPKVFMGEYAAQSVAIVSPNNRNNLECALAEAAYMTGLERNADVVRMASYAPLFANEEAWQWTPDLIWANSLHVYGTPNYYAQRLFMKNRGDVVLPISCDSEVQKIPPAGGIGLGAAEASAEFKDVRVSRGSETLLATDFASGAKDWNGGSDWIAQGGTYTRKNARGTSISFAGSSEWQDYSVSLKARKGAGTGGVLIVVRANGAEDYVAWHLGGWGNQEHGIECRLGQQDALIDRVNGSLEAGRWYDVRVELKGTRLECYLDGQHVETADVPARQTPSFFASATRDEVSKELIVKAVNDSSSAITASVQIHGWKAGGGAGQATVLTSGSPQDVNSFEAPEKVVPIMTALNGAATDFSYTFRPWSLTVLRLGGPISMSEARKVTSGQ
jgi:alpha-L-arabinofuranosidase